MWLCVRAVMGLGNPAEIQKRVNRLLQLDEMLLSSSLKELTQSFVTCTTKYVCGCACDPLMVGNGAMLMVCVLFRVTEALTTVLDSPMSAASAAGSSSGATVVPRPPMVSSSSSHSVRFSTLEYFLLFLVVPEPVLGTTIIATTKST